MLKNIGYRQLACKSNYIKSELFPGQLVCLIFGASYGSVFGEMDDFISDNEMLKKMLAGSGDNYIESFLPTLMVIMAIVATNTGYYEPL